MCSGAHAGGDPPWLKGKPAPIYPAAKGACYVLLKPQEPYIKSSDEPVCRAILANLNRACDAPPQYDGIRIHPQTTDLSGPEWQRMPFDGNMDLVRWLIRPFGNEADREAWWQAALPTLKPLIESNTLKLSRADIEGLDDRGVAYTVYRLKDAYPDGGAFNEAALLFAEPGEREPSSRFTLYNGDSGELIRFNDHWYLARYSTLDRRFVVMTFYARPGNIGTVEVCALQHLADRRASK
jgi:hypothetical protein